MMEIKPTIKVGQIKMRVLLTSQPHKLTQIKLDPLNLQVEDQEPALNKLTPDLKLDQDQAPQTAAIMLEIPLATFLDLQPSPKLLNKNKTAAPPQ